VATVAKGDHYRGCLIKDKGTNITTGSGKNKIHELVRGLLYYEVGK